MSHSNAFPTSQKIDLKKILVLDAPKGVKLPKVTESFRNFLPARSISEYFPTVNFSYTPCILLLNYLTKESCKICTEIECSVACIVSRVNSKYAMTKANRSLLFLQVTDQNGYFVDGH